jgi:hypothetical protein
MQSYSLSFPKKYLPRTIISQPIFSELIFLIPIIVELKIGPRTIEKIVGEACFKYVLSMKVYPVHTPAAFEYMI